MKKPDAPPNSIPSGWTELPLGNLAQLIRGVVYQKKEASDDDRPGYLPVLRAVNIRDGSLILKQNLVYVPRKNIKPAQLLRPGDVVICMSSGSQALVGKAAQLTEAWTGACGAFCAVVRLKPNFDPKFAGYFFHSDYYRRLVQAAVSGVNINNLRYEALAQLPLPVPPLVEQRRLGVLLERYLSRLDAGIRALQQAQAKLERYCRAVAQAAVTGQLVAQNPADEPAPVLLQRLQAERNIAGPEILFDQTPLPPGWAWASLSALAEARAGYPFKSSHYSPSGFQIVKIANVGPGKLKLKENPTFISQPEAKLEEKYLLRQGDLVITLTGTRRKRDYGFVALVQNERGLLLNQRVARLRFQPPLDPRFFLLSLQSDHFRERFFHYETGNTGQGNVRMAALVQEAVPVPPVAEQGRIVAEVEHRLRAAALLASTIQAKLQGAAQLRQVILACAFSGRLSQ